MRSCLVVVVLFAICGLTVNASAQEEYTPPKPSEQHAILKKDVGTWDAEIKMWTAPGTEPMVSKGSETNEMFGEFWVMSKFSGNMMGMEFSGRGTFGYDPNKKKFVGTWCDTMNPTMSFMEGTYDESTKTMTMKMSGGAMQGKNVTVHKDDNTRIFTMYMLQPGTEDEYIKQMEITYKRR